MDLVLKAKSFAKKIAKEKQIKLKDALELISKENGFSSWKNYKNSLDVFWYRKMSPFLTNWFVTHDEASSFNKTFGGYLLTYKGQYFVVSKDYIRYIGLDPDDKIWEAIDYDVSTSLALNKLNKFLEGVKR